MGSVYIIRIENDEEIEHPETYFAPTDVENVNYWTGHGLGTYYEAREYSKTDATRIGRTLAAKHDRIRIVRAD